jgi:hypothetical protein
MQISTKVIFGDGYFPTLLVPPKFMMDKYVNIYPSSGELLYIGDMDDGLNLTWKIFSCRSNCKNFLQVINKSTYS